MANKAIRENISLLTGPISIVTFLEKIPQIPPKKNIDARVREAESVISDSKNQDIHDVTIGMEIPHPSEINRSTLVKLFFPNVLRRPMPEMQNKIVRRAPKNNSTAPNILPSDKPPKYALITYVLGQIQSCRNISNFLG